MSEMIVASTLLNQPRFVVRLAADADEVAAAQRLRYRIFAEELGAQLESGGSGLDIDRYDPYCRHLMVVNADTGEIVACTRALSDASAAAAGGFYSESEFDLELLRSLPGRVLEIGRTCVAKDYRNGAVIALLWQGIAELITREGFDYLFGCASIDLADGGTAAHRILQSLRAKHMSPATQRVRPYCPLPAADLRVADESGRMPPLLKAYVSLGAKVCGEPYWDRDFNCADVFMLLNVSELNPRYARHFLGRKSEGNLALAA